MKKFFTFLALFFFLGSESLLHPQTLIQQAVGKYRQGDLEGALVDFETVLSKDKENIKAKEYLLNCLVVLGEKYAQEKAYFKALSYLERAIQLAPDDREVNTLYNRVKSEVSSFSFTPTDEKEPKEAFTPEPVVKKEAARKLEKEREREKESKLLKELESIIFRIDQQREDLLREIEEQEKKQNIEIQHLLRESKRVLQQHVLYGLIVLAVLSFIILGLVYANVKSNAKVRDKFLL